MIQLAWPWALLALPLPYLIWHWLPAHRERVQGMRFPFFRRIIDAAGAEARPGSVILTRSRIQITVLISVWGLIVLALAQPQRVGAPIERTQAARDVVLAIDISGSMDTRDFEQEDGQRQQRLAAVKQVVSDFIVSRQGDRLGLIVFGTKAYVQAPLTEDLDTVQSLLERTAVGMAGPTTALGDSIGLAIRTFEASDIDQRLMILLSDGSDTASSMSPVNAAEIAASERVEIYTIGVGDPDATGEARVDLAGLRDIARRTGGAYFYASDTAALSEVYARIDALAPRETETLSYRPRESLAFWPLGLAAVIGLLSLSLQWYATRSGRRHGLSAQVHR
ncbi:MAG: VWA domain-containing protein [Pseudomonadota bacterium]